MASTDRANHLLIDGLTYAVSRDGQQSSLQRSHQAIEPSQLSGLRVQPPFLASETQSWEGGEGVRVRDDVTTAYFAGRGVEPHAEGIGREHLRLKVGRQIETWQTVAGAGGFLALVASERYLYAGPAVGDDFYRWNLLLDTFAATTGHATGSGYTSWLFDITALVVWYTKGGSANLYQTNVTLEHSYSGTESFLLAAYRDASTLSESFVWTLHQNGPSLQLWKYLTTGAGTATEMGDWAGSELATAIAVGDTSHIWVRPQNGNESPRAELWTWNTGGAGAAGTKTALSFQGNYPVSACYFNGDVYLGMAWGGRIYKQTGTSELTEVLRISDAGIPGTVPGTDAIYAMCVHDGSLYAAGYDASAPSGQRIWIRRFDGEGWHLVSVGGDDASIAIRSMTSFLGTLVLGDQEATDGRLYKLSTSLRLLSAQVETSKAIYGTIAIQKRFTTMALEHTALVAGQAVEGQYSLDDATYVSAGVNRDVGSVRTAFALPTTVRGIGVRTKWVLTNVSGADLILTGDSVTALPTPPSREVWQADLQLAADAYDTADTRTELDRYNALRALQDVGAVFQVVHEYRDRPLPDPAALPLLAMRAAFDPQVPLQTRDLGIGGGAISSVAPVRLVQAAQPENLVKNASFEQDADGAVPTDWGTAMGTGTSAVVDDAAAFDGGKSLLLTFNGSAAFYGRTQSVSGLVPGRWYTLSLYVRRNTTAGVLDADVLEGATVYGSSISLAAAIDAAFIRYSATFLYGAAGSGTVTVRLYGDGTPTGSAWYDGIALHEGAPAPPFAERGSAG